MNTLILGYKRGRNKWETILRALWDLDEDADVVTEDFDKIEGPYDRIITVAESLLPIQAKLEKKWGLNNLSEETAAILSDKKMMDDKTKLDLVTQAMQVIENAVRLAVEKGNDTDLPIALAMLELINPTNHTQGE